MEWTDLGRSYIELGVGIRVWVIIKQLLYSIHGSPCILQGVNNRRVPAHGCWQTVRSVRQKRTRQDHAPQDALIVCMAYNS